jgi:hypothetical protein
LNCCLRPEYECPGGESSHFPQVDVGDPLADGDEWLPHVPRKDNPNNQGPTRGIRAEITGMTARLSVDVPKESERGLPVQDNLV